MLKLCCFPAEIKLLLYVKPMVKVYLITVSYTHLGMNITAFEYEDSIIVVDCGLSFPEDDMLGIVLVIPCLLYTSRCV